MTTELVELAEQMRKNYASMRDYELDRRQRETRASCASAMQHVCAAMAGNAMVGAVFIKDPQQAAKSFDDSMRWQVAGILASLGDPKIVSEYLSEPPAAPEPVAVGSNNSINDEER